MRIDVNVIGSRGRPILIALAAVWLLALASCGGAEPVVETPPAPASAVSSPDSIPTQSPTAIPTAVPSPKTAAPVEPAEYQIESADGSARLTVQIISKSPAGGAGITLNEVSRADWPEEMAGIEPVGPVYEISASGVELDEPALVSITLDPTALARAGIDPAAGMGALILVSRSDDGQWELLAGPETRINLTTGEVVVSASISHFSTLFALKTDYYVRLRISPTRVVIPVGPDWTVRATVTSLTIEDIAVRSGHSTRTDIRIARALTTFRGETLLPVGQTVRLEPDFTFRCVMEGKDEYRVYIEYRFVREMLSEEATTGRFLAAFGMIDFDEIEDGPEIFMSLVRPVECLPFGAEVPTPTFTPSPTPVPNSHGRADAHSETARGLHRHRGPALRRSALPAGAIPCGRP